MVQNPPKNNLCKCLPPNFHRQIYDLPIRAGRVPTLGPDRGSPPFAPKALPAMDLSNQQQQTLGEKCGVHIFQCRDESNVEMRKKAKLPQYRHLQSPTVRGPLRSSARNPTRLSFFAANLRKPRMGETCLIGVSVSGEHCSRTWSHVVYAAEQTKILGAAWIYRANRMAWISCSADAKIPRQDIRYISSQTGMEWTSTPRQIINPWYYWMRLDVDEGPISLNLNSQRM